MFCKNNFDKVTNLFGDVEERLVWDEILAMSLCIGHCAVADRAINHFAGRARRHYHYCCCQQAPWDKKEEIAYVWRDEHFCVCPFAEKTNNYLQDTLRRIRGFLSTRNHLFCYKHVYAWIKSVKTKPRRRTNNYHFLSSSVTPLFPLREGKKIIRIIDDRQTLSLMMTNGKNYHDLLSHGCFCLYIPIIPSRLVKSHYEGVP